MYIGLIFIKVVVGTQLKRNWMKSSNDAFYTRVRVYMLTYYITVLTFFYSFLDPFSCFLLVHLFPFVSLENFTRNEPIFSALLLTRKESISIGIFFIDQTLNLMQIFINLNI